MPALSALGMHVLALGFLLILGPLNVPTGLIVISRNVVVPRKFNVASGAFNSPRGIDVMFLLTILSAPGAPIAFPGAIDCLSMAYWVTQICV